MELAGKEYSEIQMNGWPLNFLNCANSYWFSSRLMYYWSWFEKAWLFWQVPIVWNTLGSKNINYYIIWSFYQHHSFVNWPVTIFRYCTPRVLRSVTVSKCPVMPKYMCTQTHTHQPGHQMHVWVWRCLLWLFPYFCNKIVHHFTFVRKKLHII